MLYEVITKKKNIRLLKLPTINCKLPSTTWDMKKVAGGLLVQNMDMDLIGQEMEFPTKAKPTDEQMNDLMFAWKIVKHTKSNGIAIAKNLQSVGIGPGQVNRIRITSYNVCYTKLLRFY